MIPHILLTTTSFQDTPGDHQTLIAEKGVKITSLRGPLKEVTLLDQIHLFDGMLCGDDEITEAVIRKGAGSRLKVISKYGTGLDKVDVDAARNFGVKVFNCPGINKESVAEHVFALLLCHTKNIIQENCFIQDGQWKRLTGINLFGKTIGILGTGYIGTEVAKRAVSFGMRVLAYDKEQNYSLSKKIGFSYVDDVQTLVQKSDIISLNLPLNSSTVGILGEQELQIMRRGVIIVNTARADLVKLEAIKKGLDEGIIGAYLTDVLEEEPIVENHLLLGRENVLITPHIASRTKENVIRQGIMAVENLFKVL